MATARSWVNSLGPIRYRAWTPRPPIEIDFTVGYYPGWTAHTGRVHDREGVFPKGATLPNLIVYIDRRDGVATSPSLFALSEGRRIAHAAGLTVFALALDEPNASSRAESFASGLGRAGADRVLFCEAPGLGAPPLDVTHGRALFTAVERVPPIVVLFPTGGPGEELGPPLAMRLGAAYAPAVDVVLSEEAGPLADGVGRINLRRWRADRSGYRQLDPVEIERPVVAILGAHGAPREDGTPDVDIEVISCPASTDGAAVSELGSEPDELDAVAQARALVILAPDLAPEIGARLRAGAPAGVAVVDGAHAAHGLSAASPELVLAVGRADLDLELGVSPRAPIGLVRIDDGGGAAGAAANGATNGAKLNPDLVWNVNVAASGAASGDPWAELIAAWSALQ